MIKISGTCWIDLLRLQMSEIKINQKRLSDFDSSLGGGFSLGRKTGSMSTERRTEIRGSRVSRDTVILQKRVN